ncbi:MAG: hypothetical protein ABWZ85_11950, partial [Luteibacter sp.]
MKHLPTRFITMLPALAWLSGCGGAAPPTHVNATGADIAQALQARYDDSRTSCGTRAPAFLCSGLLVREVANRGETPPWDPDPADPAAGAFVFQFVRHDAQPQGLGNGGNAYLAMVYQPVIGRPAGFDEFEIRCVFPMPADIRQRTDRGCGSSIAGGVASAPCLSQVPPIDDSAKWFTHYMAAGAATRAGHQCGLDVTDAQNEKAVDAFR